MTNQTTDGVGTPNQEPVATQPQAHGGQYLCYAWGESDWPVAAFAADWPSVRHFIIEQWLGDADAQDYDGTPTLARLKEEFDAPEWDMVDSLEWTFEIGGVRITKVFDVSATPPTAPVAPAQALPAPVEVEALRLASPQGWISVEERLPAINELVFGVAAGGALSVFSRDDGGGDGWLWSRQMWAWNIAAPDGIEADDDYDVRFWRPMFELPAPEATKGNS